MTSKQRTKLELIRIEGICRMLLSKIDEADLSVIVENVTQIFSQDIRKAIFRLPRYQLIEVVERLGSAITTEDIDEAYEQYRYGLKPGFTLYSINSKSKKISEASAYTAVSTSLSQIPYDQDENIKSITAKAHSKISANVIEYSFFYLNKHSYLTENEEPAFVYEYEECFAWIDVTNGFLAIKNVPDKVSTIIKRAFSAAYDTQFTNIKLTKKLIHDIFGDEKIKKGSFIKPNASNDEAEKLVVSDSRFSEKQAVQNSVSGYDMTATYLTETVGENEHNTLGINCEKGKLYLTQNVSASLFREWSVDRIESIIKYLSDGADFSDFSVFQAKNIMDGAIWNGFSAPKKILMEKICYAVYVACQNKQDCYILECTLLEIRRTLHSHFYTTFRAECGQCDGPFIPRCVCGSPVLSATRAADLLCTVCGEIIDTVVCEEGHQQTVPAISDVLLLYPNNEILRNIKASLKMYFGIDFVGSFYVYDGQLTLLPELTGGIVSVDSIPELKYVGSIHLEEDEYATTLASVKRIKEKCRKSANKNCNSCVLNDESICMMKLFMTNPTYRPSPHQGLEFGDINFTVTVTGTACELVGIAKSAVSTKSVLNLSEASTREMIQQVLSATHDARVGLIAAICPMRFHDQVVEELRYIAKLTGKSIVVLDDMFMVRQYKAYMARSSSS